MTAWPAEIDLWRPARPSPLTMTVTGYVVLMGFAVKESSGTAAAEVDIYNGTDNKGLLTLPVTLTASQSTSEWYGPNGLEMSEGLFVVIASGAATGTLWIADYRGTGR